MTQAVRRRVALFLFTLVAGLAALFAFRSLAAASVAMVLSSLSAQAVAGAAGAGKAGAAAGSIHGPAFIGALMGALLQLLQLRDRPLPARIIITLVSLVAAYFGGVFGAEEWGLGPGGIGVVGTAAAYVVVPVLDALRALLADIPWLKRLLFRRVTGEADSANP